MAGSVRDRANRVTYQDKALVMRNGARLEQMDQVTLFEDFIVDVLADSPYVTVTQSGTPTGAAAISATAGDPVAGHGGWLAGASDDVDAEIDEISFGGLGTGAGTPWLRPDQVGQGMIVMEARISVPTALTARQYFVGLTDDPVEGTGTNGSLNIGSAYTVTAVANDAAGFIFSSLATAPTIWKYASAKATVVSTASASTEGETQVADTDTILRVEIDVAGNAYFYQSQGVTASRRAYTPPTFIGSQGAAVTATVALVPIITAAATTTTAVPWEIDYVYASAPR